MIVLKEVLQLPGFLRTLNECLLLKFFQQENGLVIILFLFVHLFCEPEENLQQESVLFFYHVGAQGWNIGCQA